MTTAVSLAQSVAPGVSLGFKNRIINGAMTISQRGTSFSTPASGSYTLDRWAIGWGGAAPASVAQVAGPTGFRNALQLTGAASNTQTQIIQRIESYNCSDLSGQNVTIQANIAVSTNQTVLWYLQYANSQDSFGSVTYITSGTWSATSTATTFSATATNIPAGATNGLQLIIFPNNAGAFTSGTITVTGVQLEVGTAATNFEFRDYGRELIMCQRYYVNIPVTYWTIWCGDGNVYNCNNGVPVTMRTTPSATNSVITAQTGNLASYPRIGGSSATSYYIQHAASGAPSIVYSQFNVKLDAEL